MKKTNRLTEKRSERKKVFLKSGAYLIVTDAEKTEKNYFEGIKNIIPDSLKNDLQIKIYSNKALSKIIDFAAEQRNKDERFRDIWLVFDRDEVKNFDGLIIHNEIWGIDIVKEDEKKILYSTVVAHSYSGVHDNADVILDGWTLQPSKLPADSSVLLVDDIFDSGATVNYLVDELIKQGLKRENIKIAVHDYKYFHDKKEQYEHHPDYWCRKHDIYTEKDNLWIHYMSHELVGLSTEELEENYYSKNPALRNVFKGILN